MSRRARNKKESHTEDPKRGNLSSILEGYSLSLREVALTLFVFGLLVWLYVVAIQITHPNWLSAPLARYGVPPFNWRVDDVGVIAFALAGFGFFMWLLETRRSRIAV